MTDPKHPGQPRDIDLNAWLDGVGFHPADTGLKQRAHELARLMVATFATHMHQLLPPGRDKNLLFTLMEDVLMRANRALALGGGPRPPARLEGEGGLVKLVADFKQILEQLGGAMPTDPRIGEYEAQQRGETTEAQPLAPFVYRRELNGAEHYTELEMGITGVAGPEPEVKITVVEHDEFENVTDGTSQYLDDPEVLEELASYALAMSTRLRALQARPAVADADETQDPL
jgi:hypothetical protein